MHEKPQVRTGALAGGMLMAALLGAMYPLFILFKLPFVPFDVFAWLVRSLPGNLIVAALEAMVAVLHALRLPLDTAGKVAEFMMAIGFYIALGAAVGAGVYAFVRRRQDMDNPAAGIVAGLLLAAPVVLLVGLEPTAPARLFDPLYLMLAFGGWGALLSWSYKQLVELSTE